MKRRPGIAARLASVLTPEDLAKLKSSTPHPPGRGRAHPGNGSVQQQ